MVCLDIITKTYTYTDATTTPTPKPFAVSQSVYISTATTSDSYTYLDGFDRTIQTKREAESANGWITKDILYNGIGAIGQETLPYFATTSAYTVPTTTQALYVIQSWLELLENDKKAVFTAASAASKAADYLRQLGMHGEWIREYDEAERTTVNASSTAANRRSHS